MVDFDYGQTQPILAGAVSGHDDDGAAPPNTSAGRASAISRKPAAAKRVVPQQETLVKKPRSRRRMFFAAALIALLVLAGLAVGREIIRNNYYVTAHDGTVSIMRGISGSILGIRMQNPYLLGCLNGRAELSQISYGQSLDNLDCRLMRLEDLRPSERAQVAAGLPGGSLDDAIAQLRELSRTSLLPPCRGRRTHRRAAAGSTHRDPSAGSSPSRPAATGTQTPTAAQNTTAPRRPRHPRPPALPLRRRRRSPPCRRHRRSRGPTAGRPHDHREPTNRAEARGAARSERMTHRAAVPGGTDATAAQSAQRGAAAAVLCRRDHHGGAADRGDQSGAGPLVGSAWVTPARSWRCSSVRIWRSGASPRTPIRCWFRWWPCSTASAW